MNLAPSTVTAFVTDIMRESQTVTETSIIGVQTVYVTQFLTTYLTSTATQAATTLSSDVVVYETSSTVIHWPEVDDTSTSEITVVQTITGSEATTINETITQSADITTTETGYTLVGAYAFGEWDNAGGCQPLHQICHDD
ncbi:uncharacterized protein N7443_009202 [Penicillium atrosanguineum]|uniref:uncharacterized protein n=1 Tax=Penicillium atrosanguineum TaxID=1132637 RepID=UPI00239F8095|nr:uncharacterized protein N7443_009202 [Penicillium atrosanguineum]KAJ5293249.1 hypothetical protein N7443_009202 [Penicillium atrosanguineum]